MATKPKPTVKAPVSKPRRYTQAEIDAINKAAPGKIDKLNQDSADETKKKLIKANQDNQRKNWNALVKQRMT